jgi:hypothetical protein
MQLVAFIVSMQGLELLEEYSVQSSFNIVFELLEQFFFQTQFNIKFVLLEEYSVQYQIRTIRRRLCSNPV